MTKYTCDLCGQDAYPHNSILVQTDNDLYLLVHRACYDSYIGKCNTCALARTCSLELDNTAPKYVMETSRQGPMTIQAQVLNPILVDKHCVVDCQCWDGKNCRRQTIQTCQSYKLIVSERQ